MKRQRNKIRLPIHIVWSTHERRSLIKPEMERRLYRYIEAVCREMRCDVLAVGGMPDHIHLLVNFTPTVMLSALLKRVKGASSHFISQEWLNGDWFAWQAHYAALAVEPDRIDQVVAYIANQKQHHANNTTLPAWEETCEEYDVEEEATTS
jgi:putative transposase